MPGLCHKCDRRDISCVTPQYFNFPGTHARRTTLTIGFLGLTRCDGMCHRNLCVTIITVSHRFSGTVYMAR